MNKTYTITTAISYPNGAPHIGHAYELIATDAIARFKRLDGYDVAFFTGTDEHGQKMQKTADSLSISPQELVNQNTPAFIKMADAVLSSHQRFIRTTDADHIRSAQAIWRAMETNQDIYKSEYAGWYSVRDEAFYAESETTIDDNGVRLGGQGTPVEWVSEESYFFRLSNYQEKLLAHYKNNPGFIQPESRRNEVIKFVEGGLEDLSISRTSFSWGVPVPNDENHVMYVWVDALTNYITAAGYPDTHSDMFQKTWPANAHIIGKDIIRFHAVYWPAFLMSAGIELPKTIFGHGFLFNKGEKMSKSVGNVVDPMALVDGYGADQLRYFLLREVPFGADGSYSHEAIIARVNADLANDLGNLAQRSLSMLYKTADATLTHFGDLTKDQRELMRALDALPQTVRTHMDAFEIHLALHAIFKVVAEANRVFATLEPWTLKKDNPPRMTEILSQTAEVVRRIAILMQPFTPLAATKLLDQLNIPDTERALVNATHDFALKPNHKINKPEGVFPRLQQDQDG